MPQKTTMTMRKSKAPFDRLFPMLAAVSLTAFAQSAQAATGSDSRSASRDIAIVGQWISGLQYADPREKSYGAIKMHNTAALVAPDGKQYFHISPYFASVALMGLLKADVPGKSRVAELWIDWYLRHMDRSSKSAGIVYDTWYLTDGSGETTCPPGLPASQCNYVDASDSGAATLIADVWEYVQLGKSKSFMAAPGRKKQLETVANVMTALQQSDGLTWAKDTYRVKYTMDNSEVYWGLHAMARIESDVYHDTMAARRYEVAAVRVRSGILTSLLDKSTGLYRVAKFEDGKAPAPNLGVWYADTIAQVWPQLFGVVGERSAQAKTSVRLVNARWNRKGGVRWTTSFVDPGGYPCSAMAYAALLLGDRESARTHTDMVLAREMPGRGTSPGFSKSFIVSDAGWLLLVLTGLGGG